MAIQRSLKKMRAQWIERLSSDLARGEGVRADFKEQLVRFYDLLEQTVLSGDFAWLDPILFDWGRSSTETNLETGDYDISFVMNRMIALTMEVIHESLGKDSALEASRILIPILTQCLIVVIRYEMESRVAHITHELGKVQEKYQELDRSKSNFISVAAHELKTPLTLIEGYTSMMMETVERSPGDTSIADMLKGVDTGVRRLRRIIDDMIDVSLIDNNLLVINMQPVWISHLLRLLKNELIGTMADRKQSLVIEIFEGNDIMIYGDSERLFQALHNVAINAIKYTPDHGTITLSGRLLSGFVELTIKDTGIGISMEHQSIIFEKFGQLGRTDLHSSGRTKFKGGGPGLGLPIARGILEAHGGTIWVESPGYNESTYPGSTFHVLLPIRGEPSDPKVASLFSNLDIPTKAIETRAKENSPTDNPAS
jgi:signal transduction histidine kinase